MDNLATKQEIKDVYQFCSQLNDMINVLTEEITEKGIMSKKEIENKYIQRLYSIYTPLKGGCLMEIYNLED